MEVICINGIHGIFEKGKSYTLESNGSVVTDKTSMVRYSRMGQTRFFICELGDDVAIFDQKNPSIKSLRYKQLFKNIHISSLDLYDVIENKNSHYFIDVSEFDELDVYAICKLYGVDDSSGAIHHALKKILCPGKRSGGKGRQQDISEAIGSLKRYMTLNGYG